MGIRSTEDWSGIRVNGVTLGVPAVDEETGEKHWDGGVPNGVIADDLQFQPDGADDTGNPLPSHDMGQLAGLEIAVWAQPEGAHDAYAEGAIVDHNGFWKSTTPANVWEPGVSGWRQLGASVDDVFPWVQPTGGHDAYKLGALVTHNGQTWENTGSDANVWAPGVFGWTVV